MGSPALVGFHGVEDHLESLREVSEHAVVIDAEPMTGVQRAALPPTNWRWCG